MFSWVKKSSAQVRLIEIKVRPVLILAALLILASALWLGKGWAEESGLGAETLAYPVKLFQDGRAKHFEFKSEQGPIIRYFILKSEDGVIRAAFDACDVCWPAGQGYAQKGRFMICRNCGRRFASDKINVLVGGCNPAPLQYEIKGEEVLIKTADLLAGAKYFDFSREGKP